MITLLLARSCNSSQKLVKAVVLSPLFIYFFVSLIWFSRVFFNFLPLLLLSQPTGISGRRVVKSLGENWVIAADEAAAQHLADQLDYDERRVSLLLLLQGRRRGAGGGVMTSG